MQICSCLVLIGGDIGNSVTKDGVTAPEVALLRRAHGDDSVRNITIKENAKIDHDQERERLSLVYGAEKVASLFGQFGNLPETLKEARVQDDVIVEDLTKKTRTRKAANTAETDSGE